MLIWVTFGESLCPKDVGSGKLEVGEDKRKFGEMDGNDENKMPLFFPKKAYADLSEMLGNGKSTSMLWKTTRWLQLKYFWNFHPDLWGRWTHFDEHIFQMGWFNHQLFGIFGTHGMFIPSTPTGPSFSWSDRWFWGQVLPHESCEFCQSPR